MGTKHSKVKRSKVKKKEEPSRLIEVEDAEKEKPPVRCLRSKVLGSKESR